MLEAIMCRILSITLSPEKPDSCQLCAGGSFEVDPVRMGAEQKRKDEGKGSAQSKGGNWPMSCCRRSRTAVTPAAESDKEEQCDQESTNPMQETQIQEVSTEKPPPSV